MNSQRRLPVRPRVLLQKDAFSVEMTLPGHKKTESVNVSKNSKGSHSARNLLQLPKLSESPRRSPNMTDSASNIYMKAQYQVKKSGGQSMFPQRDKVLELSSARQSVVNSIKRSKSRLNSDVDMSFHVHINEIVEAEATLLDLNGSRIYSNNHSRFLK